MITINDLKAGLPKGVRKFVTQNVVDVVNDVEEEDGEHFAEVFRTRIISHSKILNNDKFKMKDYLNAVKYVSHKLLQNSDIDSYMMTFPERYQRMLEMYADLGDEAVIRSRKISSYVSEYNKNDLVIEIAEQAIVPSHVLNAPTYQLAVGVQTDLMLNANSETVRQNAADSLMTHLKPPEVAKIEIDMSIKDGGFIDDLRRATAEHSLAQQNSIRLGTATTLEIAESKIIEAEVDEE